MKEAVKRAGRGGAIMSSCFKKTQIKMDVSAFMRQVGGSADHAGWRNRHCTAVNWFKTCGLTQTDPLLNKLGRHHGGACE